MVAKKLIFYKFEYILLKTKAIGYFQFEIYERMLKNSITAIDITEGSEISTINYNLKYVRINIKKLFFQIFKEN